MNKTILENQVIIMKSLLELVSNPARRADLERQIMFTEARLRALV